MTFDYSQTFRTEEEAICKCPPRFKVLVLAPDFVDHLDAVSGSKTIYRAVYVCKDCFKPVKFYVQECDNCPEEKCFFYGRPPHPKYRGWTLCLNCKKEIG